MTESRVRVIDLETTGLAPPAEVCEVGVCDVVLSIGRTVPPQIIPPASWLCQVETVPADARAVHHISAADCAKAPEYSAAFLSGMLPEADVFAAHNAGFEMQWFQPARPIICTWKCALRVWPQAPSHGNMALRYWLEDSGIIAVNAALAWPPHRAGPDAYITAHILVALLASGVTGREMVAWSREPPVMPRCPIGKFRGEPWRNVEAGFLKWITRQKAMGLDLIWNAQRELDRRERRDADQ